MQWTCYMKHELSKKLGTISEFLFKRSKYVAFFRLIALTMSLFHKCHFCFSNLHLSLGGAVIIHFIPNNVLTLRISHI
jgi:hypothetical protein